MGVDVLAKPEVTQFLRQPLFACLATVNPDGSPHQTYVWFQWTGSDFLVSTSRETVKYRNVTRERRASLAIIDPLNPYRYISIIGNVAVSTDGADDLILDLAVRYLGQEKGRAFTRQFQSPDRVVLRLAPHREILNGF